MEMIHTLAIATKHLKPGSVYQVLIGKRTATTLFYAYQHDIEGLFALLPTLDKAVWEKATANASIEEEIPDPFLWQLLSKRKGYIQPHEHQMHQLSYRLLFQVLANSGKEQHYVPMTHHVAVQQLVKYYLAHQQQAGVSILELKKILHLELVQVLEQLPSPALADALVSTLSGSGVNAWTPVQLIDALGLPKTMVRVLMTTLWDHFEWGVRTSDVSALQFFQYGVTQRFPAWNTSVARTKNLAQAGWTLEQIADKRHLKESTIADHFVELLLDDPAWLKLQLAEEMKQHPLPLNDHPPLQYRLYKEQFPNHPFWLYRYWQILAKKRGEQADV
ncbi:MAG: helix-turn-helix domain-containing protein [Aerococcus sp.]|nr:helix-turn-helix domain-containing protein [Aerococcus sp.]